MSPAAMPAFMRGERTPAWRSLIAHRDAQRGFDLREAFARDARRFDTLSLQAPEVFADLSKQRWDADTRALLTQLATECDVPAQRDAMFAGAPINGSEGRAALHTALRAPRGQAPHSDEVHDALDAMLAFAERVRADAAITDIVNIGIGGSDLGPQMATLALAGFVHPRLAMHFVGNVDAHQIAPLLARLQPQRTLVIVASKTFTTQETMANACVARDWFHTLGAHDFASHFVATTSRPDRAADFGITTTFGFGEWVGGRLSLWSTIGLPLAIAIGADHFRALLAGAHAMDRHFADVPPAQNLPMTLGLLDVWQRNFLGFTSRCVAPYDQRLARLPAYLQQLEMESNGKCVDRHGEPLPHVTSPVVWGEPGTNGQHAFFQQLHQGGDIVPVEFILVRRPDHDHPEMHTMLLANGLAQSQALMRGKTFEEALAEDVPVPAGLTAQALARQRTFPGNRPSTTLMLDALTPSALGALIAMYEHRVFTAAAVWGLNPFDQWGVELGKTLANELLPRMSSGEVAGLDGSTAGLLQRLQARH